MRVRVEGTDEGVGEGADEGESVGEGVELRVRGEGVAVGEDEGEDNGQGWSGMIPKASCGRHGRANLGVP